ncbi:MAG: hypothetical protein ACOX0L_09430 [Natronincolaceae bacterium]|jgi:F0F1-type ATP synthase membrane subunit a|nr:hypothetical protein [Bacillota bacterium]NLK91409.1 hypothetical protein [Clostridiales bacterium]
MPILAGIVAALFSYLLNKLVLKKIGNIGIIIVVPFVEEISKTVSALILKTNLVATHLVFGIIEGIYDIVNSSEKTGKWAALVSLASHGIFGAATYLTTKMGYSVCWGIALAWLLHSGWNWLVTKT